MVKKPSRKATLRRKKALNRMKGLRADPAEVSGVVTTDNISPANSNATLSSTGAFQRSAFLETSPQSTFSAKRSRYKRRQNVEPRDE